MTAPAGVAPAVATAAAGTTPNPRRPSSWRRRERVVGLLAVAPALLLVAAVMVYPVLYALWLSLHRSNGVTSTWRGLGNYADLLTDPLVHEVLINNVVFLVSVPLVVVVALVCSVLLYERVRGWRFFRVLFFVPNVLSTAVVGLMFKSLFAYQGPVNQVITAAGGAPVDFFSRGGTAVLVIVLALVWSGFGYQTLILLSGLASINPEVFEAATVDGAGWWKRLWLVTLPSIRRSLALVSILNVIYTFTSLFGFVFVMTAGGPGYDTTTLDYLLYTLAFSSSNLGAGAALGVLVFALIGVLTLVQLRWFRFSEED